MNTFSRGQRVVVTDPASPFVGKSGTVIRLRMNDDLAWVKMDEPLPPDLRSFPDGDERANNVLLTPEDCAEAVTSGPAPRRSGG